MTIEMLQGGGGVANTLLKHGMDHNALKPYIAEDGRTYITRRAGLDTNGKTIYEATPVHNAQATLRKDEWIALDTAVIQAAQPRLRAWADLRGANSYSVPNAMGHSILQHQSVSDTTPATISMSGLRRGDRDRPHFDIYSLPLPIIHKDFSFDARQISYSRNMGMPIDTMQAAQNARQVAEELEKLTIGSSAFDFGGAAVYGMTTFPQRLTQVLTSPEGVWSPKDLLNELLLMREKSQLNLYFGPWMVYVNTKWDKFLDDDYSDAKGDNTLRERIKMIDGIRDVKTLDFLPDYDIVMVQQTADVCRAVVGVDITTVQWQEVGGMELHFKVMCILVPQFRHDFYDRTGIVHGSIPE